MDRQSRRVSPMTWVYRFHRWAGLLAGWLLFAICLTGTLAVYKFPLKAWANPTLVSACLPPQACPPPLSPDEALARFQQALPEQRPRLLAFPADAYSIHSYSYTLDSGGRAWLNPHTGQMLPSLPSHFADFVQRLHARLWMGSTGRWLVGALGLLMLFSLLTGLALHWRRLGRDLFRLRLGQGGRKAWSDVHKFIAVWLLGFHLLIAATGAWLGLEPLTGWRSPPPPTLRGASGTTDRAPIAMPPPSAFIAQAQAQLPALTPTHMNFAAFGKAGASVRVQGDLPGLALVQRGQSMVVMHGDDAQPLAVVDRREQGPLTRALAMMRPLHYGYFGGRWMVLAYFLMGAACTALVFSGLAVWCARTADAAQRRQPGQPDATAPAADALMARLNAGVTAGLVLALLLAAALAQWSWTPWGTSWLAAWGGLRFDGAHDLLGRATVAPELWGFLIAWGLLALALACAPTARRAWRYACGAAALLLAALPCLSALSSGGWRQDWLRGQGEPLWIALACWLLALLCAWAAWRLAQPAGPAAAGRAPRPAAANHPPTTPLTH
ncbi:PepSY-associated TM helix domain-containing protein [Allofranklinella schreckenbergeri]|nr:PepSY-associated TM helix domain-containing protein [Allofranklinella schreckenbergeri]